MVKTMVKTQFVFYFSDCYHPGCQFLQACTQCKAFLNSGNLLMISHCFQWVVSIFHFPLFLHYFFSIFLSKIHLIFLLQVMFILFLLHICYRFFMLFRTHIMYYFLLVLIINHLREYFLFLCISV